MSRDLPSEAFHALQSRFFGHDGTPRCFELRPKGGTQDDPFDEHLATVVLADIPGVVCQKAPGPLITPDAVLYRDGAFRGVRAPDLREASDRIFGLEVKKLERTPHGSVARSSGLDYNTTPPCGTIRVYDASDSPVDIRGFYLFVCLEPCPRAQPGVMVTALALVDGDVLNADFDLYLSVVGEREKRIGLGTYRDGADRTRPMLIFSNPLGVAELDHAMTLVHRSPALADDDARLLRVGTITRTTGQETRVFYCYRKRGASPDHHGEFALVDPFPTPEREARTRPRGRFRLPLQL